MPFTPRRILLATDNARGHCSAVVPRLRSMLESRAFLVDLFEIGGEIPDLADYHGVVVGTPVTGFRGRGPSDEVEKFIAAAEGLDEKKAGIFSVYEVMPGRALERMKNLLYEKGCEVVVEHAYWRLRPHDGEQIVPAECMVRIR